MIKKFRNYNGGCASCNLAFTLAEVLVTLGIIGVVAAMTMPALIKNHQRQTYIKQLHKIYNEFQQGLDMKMLETNAVNLAEAGFVRNNEFNVEKQFLQSHFKVVNDCGVDNQSCFASSYKGLNGSIGSPSFAGYSVSIASGASISFYIDGLDTGDENTDDYLGYIYVDTNGANGPNIGGRDLFRMYVYADGVIDDYHINPACRKNNNCVDGSDATEARENNFNSYCADAGDTDGCFGKILNDGWQMTY